MKFSIITAVYNNKASLKKAIESLCAQTFKDYEHIIVDGGSTDGTVEFLRQAQDDSEKDGSAEVEKMRSEYARSEEQVVKKLRSEEDKIDYKSKLKWISEPDSGIYDAINKGISMSSGDVIGLLHSDDSFTTPDVLGKIADKFSDNDVDSVYSDLVYVKGKNKDSSHSVRNDRNDPQNNNHSSLVTDHSVLRYWKSQDPSTSLRMTKWIKLGWMPPHPTLFVRKNIFSKYGLYDTNFKIASDYEMILRLFYKH